MNVKIEVHKNDYEQRVSLIDNWTVPDSIKKDLSLFLDELALGKVNKGKQISEATRLKYIHLLRVPLEFFNKPADKLQLKDIEAFEKALTSGSIKNYKNKPFTHSVTVDIRVTLKVFLRWRLGREKADKLTDWLDCRDIKKTPDYLKESDVEQLYKACKNEQERFLIAVLFDSGARAEEFLNIRYEDVQLPEGKDNFPKITLKDEYSKTEGRVVSLYWKHSLEAVHDFYVKRRMEGIKANEPMYNASYDAMRFFVMRLGNRVLGRNIYAHLFRHSSATHYASKMNRQELCIRYGWKFSSNMPDVYISRAGMNNKELDEKFTSTELSELKAKLERAEYERKIEKEKKDAEIEMMKKQMDNIQKLIKIRAEAVQNDR